MDPARYKWVASREGPYVWSFFTGFFLVLTLYAILHPILDWLWERVPPVLYAGMWVVGYLVCHYAAYRLWVWWAKKRGWMRMD